MTEALISEDRISLAELATQLSADRSTVTRWADVGYGGRRLESYRIGKKRYTSRQAAMRFLAGVNGEKTNE